MTFNVHCPHKLGNALATPVESTYEFFGTGVPGTVSEPSIADELGFIHLLSYTIPHLVYQVYYVTSWLKSQSPVLSMDERGSSSLYICFEPR
jgi:hypothetical protein